MTVREWCWLDATMDNEVAANSDLMVDEDGHRQIS